jgi:hypothetical protein
MKAFLRNKLVSFFTNPIMKIIRNVIRTELLNESKNIQRRLQYIALKETVQYIQENLLHVNSVTSRYELLTLSFSKVDQNQLGLYCEFGVYTGNSINHIASLTHKTVFGFDSFEGLPERWRDRFEKGAFRLNKLPQTRTNVILIKGMFHETLPDFLMAHRDNIAFLHIDCDLYSSAKTIFNLIGNKIVPDTIIVFDDYFNYPGWKNGEFKAFSEYVHETKLSYEYIGYNRYSEQVAVKII